MKFTDFFWDFDGTLFDTYPRINRAIQNALREMGRDVPMDTVAFLSKVTLQYALETLCPDRAEEALRRYDAFAQAEPGFPRPYPGVIRVLESVCAAGGRNYLYTHRGESSLDALRHYGMERYFTDCMTAEIAREHGFPRKPAPDALLYLMKKHGLDPARCVMLGDRDIDLDSGKNAGMACALFDPEHYYDAYETPLRYADMFDLMADLVWEGQVRDLRVSDMLDMQRIQQQAHPEWGGIAPDKAISKLLWLVGELGEAIDVVKKAGADHLTQPGEARTRLTEEMADVAMYFHDVLNCYGITPEEFSQAYYDKMQRNLHRDYSKERRERYGGQ